MKKHLFLFILMLSPMLASAAANDGNLVSNNADQMESLYGEWWLVGWNDGGTYFEVDPNYVSHRHFSIEIPIEGSVMAYSMANSLYLGLLTLNGNEMIFDGEKFMTQVYCDIMESQFFEDHIWDIKSYQLEGNLLKLYYTDNDYFVFTSDLNNRKEAGNDYRPFVEDGKVWKIIDGKTCKQMMCQRYVSPDYSNKYWTLTSFLSKVGAWYEEDKKVYSYITASKQFRMMYDFSLDANDINLLSGDTYQYEITPKQSGGLKGFKGVYRDIMLLVDGSSYYNTTWLEGVGGIDGPIRNTYDPIIGGSERGEFLMSCTVGDEVIYYNDDREDGATPAGARKNRFDFTHTIKKKPKTRMRGGEEQSLYGEYNDLLLGINLDPLDDAYLVSITNESGKAVYEKTINAGSIVALNIDISAYAKGRYTVNVENGRESFTGEFETQTTGIEAIRNNKEVIRTGIYNLQGQRLNSLQKGLNIVNGRKIYVK